MLSHIVLSQLALPSTGRRKGQTCILCSDYVDCYATSPKHDWELESRGAEGKMNTAHGLFMCLSQRTPPLTSGLRSIFLVFSYFVMWPFVVDGYSSVRGRPAAILLIATTRSSCLAVATRLYPPPCIHPCQANQKVASSKVMHVLTYVFDGAKTVCFLFSPTDGLTSGSSSIHTLS